MLGREGEGCGGEGFGVEECGGEGEGCRVGRGLGREGERCEGGVCVWGGGGGGGGGGGKERAGFGGEGCGDV